MKTEQYYPTSKVSALSRLGFVSHLLFFFLLILWLFALILGVKPVNANVYSSVSLEVKNASYDQGNHYFDLYIRQQGDKLVYLGSSDLVISLADNTESPVAFRYIENSSQLFSNSGLPVFTYDSGIYGQKQGVNKLIINIQGAGFNEADFDYDVAEIDTRINLHKIGRFVVEGVTKQFNMQGASLYKHGSGTKTALFSYDPLDHFRLKAVEVIFESGYSISSNPIWSFDLSKMSAGVKANWNLVSEVNEMQLEKSFDGLIWERVEGDIQAENMEFGMEDINPAGARLMEGHSVIHYRLAVIGLNNKKYYSPVKQHSYLKGISMVAYPNPVLDHLNIRFNDGALAGFQVQVIGMDGRLFGQYEGKNLQEISVDLTSALPGQYIVRVLAGSELGLSRILVQR